jgi:hypothetical protein
MPSPICLLTEIPDAAWESLLPQLIHNKSAGSFALCCRKLRRQVQQGTKELSLSFRPHAALEGVDALPAHFPGCTGIKISLNEGQQVLALSALPVLARCVAGSNINKQYTILLLNGTGL